MGVLPRLFMLCYAADRSPPGAGASQLWSNPAPPLGVLIDNRSFRFNGLWELDLSFGAGFYLPKALLAPPLHQSTDASR